MKLLALFALSALAACSGVRHLTVEPDDACKAKDACSSGPCEAEVRCLPDGTCQINCTGPGGESCQVMVLPVDDDC